MGLLRRRKMEVSPWCPNCRKEKFVCHALFWFSRAKVIWDYLLCGGLVGCSKSLCCLDIWMHLAESVNDDMLGRACIRLFGVIEIRYFFLNRSFMCKICVWILDYVSYFSSKSTSHSYYDFFSSLTPERGRRLVKSMLVWHVPLSKYLWL